MWCSNGMRMPLRTPLIAAHRGAWDPEPQNSLAACRRALAMGVDMIELDVRATRDGRLVVVHDARTGGERVNQLTLQEVRERLPEAPLLEEALECCAGRTLLDLEIKVAGIEAECVKLLEPHSAEAFLITSFHAGVLDRFRRRNPHLATGLVAKAGDPGEWADHCRLAGHAALFLHHTLLPPPGAIVGPDLYAWTVNGEAPIAGALRRGDLAGIVTDEPALALAVRAAIP
jgi:glycerophosphoryl diester phosphodiesterase